MIAIFIARCSLDAANNAADRNQGVPVEEPSPASSLRQSKSLLRYINAPLDPLGCTVASAELFMRTYFFDMKDGASARDRVGLRFPTTAAAIEHGKQLARRLRGDPWIEDLGLYVSVVDESGTEVHREQVYKGLDRQRPERASRVSD
jgi:hypothetical protein